MPWTVGMLGGALGSVDVVLKVHVGRSLLNGCRCQDKRIRREVLDGGGLHDAEVLRESVIFVEWIGALYRRCWLGVPAA